MNFRTTILLFVVLVAAAAVYFITTRDPANSGDPVLSDDSSDASGQTGKKLFADLTAANVNRVSVTPAAGGRIVLERAGATEWRLLEPVKAAADAFQADDLVREILDLRTTGRADPADKGLDKPSYVIEVTDKAGKTTKLDVGTHQTVVDMLYVRPAGQQQADIVSGAILAQLEKPAGEYRKLRLLALSNDQVTGVTITHDGKTLKLAKSAGQEWQILEPKQMPGDDTQVATLLSSITNLTAVKFLSEDLKDPARYGFTKPTMTVELTTAPPTTQPATTAPATTTTAPAGETVTLKFGGPQDVFKKNLFATASDTGPLASVLATSLDALKKTPLDLRQRQVLDIDDRAVSRVSITTEKSATTRPTTQPASTSTVVLERRSEQPTSAPATAPTTGPATAPAAPATKSKWLVASDPNKGDANDNAVLELLRAFGPLTADKFLESFPTTQAAPAATYVVKISTRAWADEPAKEYELKLTDPGAPGAAPDTGFGGNKLIAQLGDLTFEIDRAIVEQLTGNFAAPTVEPAGPSFGPAGPTPRQAPPAPLLPAPLPPAP